MRKLVLFSLLLSAPALAQNSPSGSPRVQGVPAGYGDPVQVTIRNTDGSAPAALPATVSQPTASNLNAQVVGNVASGASDSGNPVKAGGLVASSGTALTNGQRGDLQLGTRGQLLVQMFEPTGNSGITATPMNADGAAAGVFAFNTASFRMNYNGTTWDRTPGNTVASSVLPGLTTTYWTYSSGASPILSNTTTAVTIKASAGGSIRNYITSCQITTTAFGASVPLAIRDGAGGTVLWALTVPTAGFLQPVVVTFPAPLRGSAATLLEIVTTTANTSGTVTANCQGFTGV